MNNLTSATIHTDNPAPRVLARYRRWQETLASGHPGLSVDIAGFRRYRGDWIGAVVTPWFIHLLLLPGGGELWRELPADSPLRVGFPAADLELISERSDDPDLPASFFATILAPVDELADQDAALRTAMDALHLLFEPPPPETPASSTTDRQPVDRRGFFRRLAGRG
jgi:[NiFe] hydrogenase assembly HybE family chaperone